MSYSIKVLDDFEYVTMPFVSYSRRSGKDIINDLKNNNIKFLSDELIDSVANNYQLEIENMIYKSTCGIIIYTGELSPYIMFEIGLLHGNKKNIYVYNPYNLKIDSMLIGYEVINDIIELKKVISDNKLFNDLLEFDTHQLPKKLYKEEIINNLSCVNLELKINELEDINPKEYTFNVLIVSFFPENNLDKSFEFCNLRDLPFKRCGCNKASKELCPLFIEEAKKEPQYIDISKNYIGTVNGNKVNYLIPLHKDLGVVFKCFVDVKKNHIASKMFEIISNNFSDVSLSKSGIGNRIYFILDDKSINSLVQVIEHDFKNNYICPGLIKGDN